MIFIKSRTFLWLSIASIGAATCASSAFAFLVLMINPDVAPAADKWIVLAMFLISMPVTLFAARKADEE